MAKTIKLTYPKMTAFHTMILFSDGAPLTPAGGSSCSLRDTVKAQWYHNIQLILDRD